ncbi:MAG: hypothetical protein S4CHLAM123_14280 [Chlamydiales bacterium]|nr:hypothetical protein [Chlamydiales bacterium]
METAHILEELAYDLGEFPREAVEAAIIKREQITPHLLAILEDVIERVDEVIEDDNYQGHLYALYLLAQFREKRAFPLILKLFSLEGESPHAIAGDVLTEDLNRIFASVCGTHIQPLMDLIENPLANEYVRAACQATLVTLVGCGTLSRGVLIDYFKDLFENKLERTPSFVWDHLIASSCNLYPEELYSSIKKAFDDNLIDSSFISLEFVATILAEDKETHLFTLYEEAELIEDSVTEMEKWQGNYDPFSLN